MSVSIIAPYEVTLAAGLEFYPAGSPLLTRLIGDPLWTNVKVLLHLNGTDGSTTFTDERGIHTWAAAGNAQLDTAQKKWGTASLLLDGTGDYAKTEDNLSDFQFGSSSWTIEGWFYLNETTGANLRVLFEFGGTAAGWSTSNGEAFVMYINNADGKTYFQYNNSGNAETLSWNHISLSGGFHFVQLVNDAAANNFTIKIDGITAASTTKISISNITTPARFNIGAFASTGGSGWNGWVDDFRVTPGVARLFAVPTAEFLCGYSTNSPAATHKFSIPGNSIQDIAECLDYLENSLGGTGSLSYGYQLNGGSLVPGQTLAQLKAAVRNAAITVHTDSLIVYVSHVSNGFQQVESAYGRASAIGGGLHVEDPAGGSFMSTLID